MAGTIDNAAAPRAQVMEIKDSLAAVQPDYLHRQDVPTSKNLAASAHSFIDTANGIIQDAKLHVSDFPLSSSSSLASSGREMQLTFAPAHPATLAPLLRTMEGGSKLAETDANATDSKPAAEAAEGGEKKEPKVLGATGKDVFGAKNGTVVGFLGFSNKEPAVLGIPLPICMFLFVLCMCISCITVGCLIARKTDILKVNKSEVGGAAKPVDEEEDSKGYDWRQPQDPADKT